ncbi:MAG: hypothetical protein FGM24_02615 [Candidatus Kapabacteria bacterium]|nr:hypothetical protein [Candidatus Kapabacteria bacterium]
MNDRRPLQILFIAVLCVAIAQTLQGQELPVRATEMRHLSTSGTHHVSVQAASAMPRNYVLRLPVDTVNAHHALLTSVNGSANDVALSWLPAGANGTVLGIVNGAPAWTQPQPIQVQPIAVLMNNMVIPVAAGTSVLRITPDAPPVNRVIGLANGLVNGQQVVLRVATPNAGFGIRMIDNAGNLVLSGDADLLNNDTMTLLWDAVSLQWIELSRRNN